MRTLSMFLLVIGCIWVSTACNSEKPPKIDTPETIGQVMEMSKSQKAMNSLIIPYLDIKDALVSGNSKKAAETSAAFGKALGTFDIMALSAENKQRWVIRSADLAAKSSFLLTKADLEQQRSAFSALSQALIATVQDMGTDGSTLYVQHCPMAFDNTGADWLSDSEKVVNPYFGDAMLHCGTVKETLN
ncbi:MAG: DUF3347 domain-containing protein [Calditrichia bacterium]